VQNAFNYIVSLTGVLFAIFYILTAIAAMAYFRRRVLSRPGDALMLGILPLASAGFLGWMCVKSMYNAPTPEQWSLVGVIVAGLVLMLVARFVLRSPFFSLQLESDKPTAKPQAVS
jgi:amino acid transporter